MATRRAWLAMLTAAVSGVAVRAQSPAAGRRVAVTIDDGPVVDAGDNLERFQQVTEGLVEAFSAEQTPVVLFVNERQFNVPGQRDARVAAMTRWLDAGFEIGNHTYSHINLNQRTLADYKEDVIQGEVITKPLLEARGQKLRWFRHPYLRTGHTPEIARELQEFLEVRGYTVAPITVDYADYSFTGPYSRRLRAGDRATAKRIANAYFDQLDAGFEQAEELSLAIFGYELPQTLLIHCNTLNATTLRQSIARMRDRGYSFITLDEALEDPAYKRPYSYVGTRGITWLKRWAMDARVPLPPQLELPEWIREL